MRHLVRRKNLIRIGISFFILLIIIFLYIFFYPLPWGISKKSTSITVEKGDNLHKISQKLGNSGLGFNSPLLFLSAKLLGIDRKIIPGRYDFQKGITFSGLLKKLSKNEISSIEVTIPEGYNLYQIASILKRETGLDSLLFVKAASDTSLIHRLGLDSKNLEGYLFPDTYRLFWKMEPEKVIELMVDEFKKIIDISFPLQLRNFNFSLSQLVTLASLVEAEARIDNERPLISAVYHNRLKIGMPLQCDPTVIYALGGLSRPLNHKDLEVDSPYNTYKHPGLPPGPINNPGKASILAALFPADVNYLYFVAKGDGSHVFSVDLEEHNRAIAKIKRENKS